MLGLKYSQMCDALAFSTSGAIFSFMRDTLAPCTCHAQCACYAMYVQSVTNKLMRISNKEL